MDEQEHCHDWMQPMRKRAIGGKGRKRTDQTSKGLRCSCSCSAPCAHTAALLGLRMVKAAHRAGRKGQRG